MAITKSQHQSILAHHMNGVKRQEIADITGVAYNTVKAKIKEYEKDCKSENAKLQNKDENNGLLQEIAKIKQEQNKELLDVLRNDNRPSDIVSKILNIINDDSELALEVSRKGLSGLNTVMGTLLDKAFKMEDLILKREAMKLNNKIFESYKPENDGFKEAMKKQLVRFDSVNLDHMIEKESKEDVQ